jgi:hypothetical protein
MSGLNAVPDDVKWRIASEFAAKLPFLYDRAFRPVAGERYDEIEQDVWIEAARTVFDIARSLNLPVGTPADLAETVRIIMIILFGPEFKSEVLEVSKDGAVILVKRCPFLSGLPDTGADGSHAFRRCMAFTLSSIPRLNDKFSARFVRTMCTGDRQCEIKVAAKPAESAGTPAKK